jgi:predicted DNA-binding protein YlxM (UPF0122 family)
MDKQDKLILLFDYYGDLLSESQRNYFESYYFDNLSLSEIGENYNVSRNAVSKDLKLASEKLNNYEDKLKIISRDDKLRKLASKIEDKDLKEKIMNILDE